MVVDIFTVLAHLVTIIILAVPLLAFPMLNDIAYSQYTLLPINSIISLYFFLSTVEANLLNIFCF